MDREGLLPPLSPNREVMLPLTFFFGVDLGSDAAAPSDGVGAAAAAAKAGIAVAAAVAGQEQQPDQGVAAGAAVAVVSFAQDEQKNQNPHYVVAAEVHVSILLFSGVPFARIHHSTFFHAVLCTLRFP